MQRRESLPSPRALLGRATVYHHGRGLKKERPWPVDPAVSARARALFGPRFARARQAAGYSLKDIAHMLAVDQAAVSRWQDGSRMPSLDHLVGLAVALEVPLDALVSPLPDDYAPFAEGMLIDVPDGAIIAGDTYRPLGRWSLAVPADLFRARGSSDSLLGGSGTDVTLGSDVAGNPWEVDDGLDTARARPA